MPVPAHAAGGRGAPAGWMFACHGVNPPAGLGLFTTRHGNCLTQENDHGQGPNAKRAREEEAETGEETPSTLGLCPAIQGQALDDAGREHKREHKKGKLRPRRRATVAGRPPAYSTSPPCRGGMAARSGECAD